ncbi:MAG: 1,4-alpha-glucan branching protein GlgB [Fusobacteriaceae bacterium]|jgi:1,4-alpha-glucan branching enzyme|nr:1,4-alpha-glucan branching protein GlgB [Fusobacteriaceae bacterium]
MKNEMDIYLFHRGEHRQAYHYLGSHVNRNNVVFRVWAPNARGVSVVGDFNGWNGEANRMSKITDGGLWEVEIPRLKRYDKYKYQIELAGGGWRLKSDPYAVYSEMRPNTASFVYPFPKIKWNDKNWLKARTQGLEKPMNIYEIHLGSWRRDDRGYWLTYLQTAEKLVEYLKEMNYTHVEIMPVGEYPLDDSWGYQATGYFSVTSRYGTPEEFMTFIDIMHQNGIGVILDWVPGHFCKDDHGLYRFDGSAVYEYADERIGENPQWGTANFNLARFEVKSFLISNALFWLREYHIDGLRIDAVANILYLTYGKNDKNIKNQYGGVENIDGINFLKELNSVLKEEFPDALVVAEDSTAWPNVTKHPVDGGLGFTSKWNMGWMNDTLKYFSEDPLYRYEHHGKLTFSFMYAFSENFILPLSHDEVVHGKKSILNKMPGFYEAKIANVKTLYSYQAAHPGKKLNFMGNEIAQGLEWRFYDQVEWHLLAENENCRNVQKYVKALNKMYLEERALWEDGWDTFEWIEHENNTENMLIFLRKVKDFSEYLIAIFNFSGADRTGYRVGVPENRKYNVILNSDDERFGGTGFSKKRVFVPKKTSWNYRDYSIQLDIKANSAVFIKAGEAAESGKESAPAVKTKKNPKKETVKKNA